MRTNIFISGDSHSGKREREMRKGMRGGETEGGRKEATELGVEVHTCNPRETEPVDEECKARFGRTASSRLDCSI